MIGVVINYRGGKHTQYPYQVIVEFPNVKSKEEAQKLVGKRVIWISPGKFKVFVGVITRFHGNKGRVRVRFRKGVPGQMIGDVVYLVEDPNLISKIQQEVKKAKDINQAHKIVRQILNV